MATTTGLSRRPQRRPTLELRWAIRLDLPSIYEIEDSCFAWDGWSEDDFLHCLRQRDCIGQVVEEKGTGKILGYVIYRLGSRSQTVLRFAVHAEHRRRGVATLIFDKLQAKLAPYMRRDRMSIIVAESDRETCRFLARRGFASQLVRGWDVDNGADGVRFTWQAVCESCRAEAS